MSVGCPDGQTGGSGSYWIPRRTSRAELSGLGAGANLRLHFPRGLGVTPTAYRCTYQGASA